MTLSSLLSIRPGITALIGGGGKTTAMYTLARELSRLGRVVCCTTTHIRPPAHLPVQNCLQETELDSTLARHSCLCMGTPVADGKLTAPLLSPAQIAAAADYVLVEADGARGLPMKAHLVHEPVIPAGSCQVILLVGASGFGKAVQAAVHRPDRFCQLTGVPPGTAVTPELLSVALRREGLGDQLFINQAETAGAMEQARRLAALLPCPVCAGSLQGGSWTCLSSFGAAGTSPQA